MRGLLRVLGTLPMSPSFKMVLSLFLMVPWRAVTAGVQDMTLGGHGATRWPCRRRATTRNASGYGNLPTCSGSNRVLAAGPVPGGSRPKNGGTGAGRMAVLC